MKILRSSLHFAGFIMLAVAVSQCTPPPPTSSAETESMLPPAETYADSVAINAYNALGGPDVFAALPLLRFNFGFERGDEKVIRNKHLWNKHTGDYRIEYTEGADSSYVVLFNVNTREGSSYLNGERLDETENNARVERAYRSFINDTYWLNAPIKMMDPGVSRVFVSDSSNASTDVVKLTFQGVGLTPGDQYWMYVDKATGRVNRWAMVLERNLEAPPRAYDWLDYQTFETPAGTLSFSFKKQAIGQPFAILTDGVAVLMEAPAGMMTNTNAMLD